MFHDRSPSFGTNHEHRARSIPIQRANRASDIAEIDPYITKYLSESVALEQQKSKQRDYKPFPLDELLQNLTKTYEAKYRDPQNCDADAAEEARDMLQRVRKAMATSGPLISTDGAPGGGEVTSARITGVMCPGALSGQELAQLELYYGWYWMRYAKTATDEDTRESMWHIKKAEATLISGWDSAKDCTTARVGQAKEVLARMPKEF